MSNEHRAFRGIWIPAEIWLNEELSMQEKVMLAEIDSLQHPERGCFKSNKKFAEFFQLSPSRVSEIISSLASKGRIEVELIRDGKEVVERRIYMVGVLGNPKGGDRKPEGGYSENAATLTQDSEGGYSENAKERGSGRGVQSEGGSKSIAPGDESPPLEGELSDDDEPRRRIPDDMPGPKDPEAKTTKAWANYAVAYRKRYGEYPVWNKRVAAQISQLVDRVGKDDAPGVAAYFLTVNDRFYVRKGHQVGQLLSDCETLVTQMRTGQQMTETRARQIDRTQSNRSSADETAELIRAKYRARQGA